MKPENIEQLRYVSRKLVRELGLLQLENDSSNISPSHWHALLEIQKKPEITISQLGALLIIPMSKISRITSALHQKKWISIQKSPYDKREKCLQITSLGQKQVELIDQVSEQKIKGAFQYLEESDIFHITHAIQIYANALEQSRQQKTNINIATLSTSRTLRQQIVRMIEDIQVKEFNIAIEPNTNISVLKAEEHFHYHHTCNFWYAINEHGEIIGCIGLKKINATSAEIKKFFVAQPYRKKGVGQKLINTLMHAASQHHFKYLFLGTVDILKAAHRFYDKCGFTQIAPEELPKKFDKCALDTVFYKGSIKLLLNNIQTLT